MLEDSQQTEPDHSQDDLFDSGEPEVQPQDDNDGTENQNGCDCKCCKQNYGMLKRILEELTKLKEQVNFKEIPVPTFNVDGSAVEKPFLAYLRKMFSTELFVRETDDELKRKILQYRRTYDVKQDSDLVLKSCFSFAYRKFVDFRNQVKIKLLSETGEDPGEMDLPRLARHLFGRFKPDLGRDTILLTAHLRCFAHERKLLRKIPAEQKGSLGCRFFKEFKDYENRYNSNQEPQKDLTLKDREEKRIVRYRAILA
ncbi:uncharacterized protein LOC143085435 isoform X1 [Mytilus galloprovincialis]|uniref:uncharacterized protein n=2 Tax=Mytilus edulis TaxID=6550 RepID=UPI0039EED91A